MRVRKVVLVGLSFIGMLLAVQAQAMAESVKQYVARCPQYAENSNCLDSISEAYVYANACGVEIGSSPAEVTDTVITWLKRHPNIEAMDVSKGIEKALEALYPCT
jgi:hypothetical protein